MVKAFVLTALCGFWISLISAQSIDPSKSKVSFEVSNMAVNTVEGTFTGMNGNVSFSPDAPQKAQFQVCIDAATVFTDNEKRDEHLRTADFFHVDRHPTICFKSESVKKTDEGYVVTGTLVMHGVSKKVTIPFTHSGKTFKGELEVNRLDYKIGEDTGTFMVGDEIELEIVCVLR